MSPTTSHIDSKTSLRGTKQTQPLVPVLRFKEFDGTWETNSCIDLFRNSRIKGYEGLPIYSVTLDRGMVPRDSLDRKTDNAANPKDNIFVAENNISYNMMRMWQGAFGKAPEDCMVSAAYVVLEPKQNVLTDFFVECFEKKRSTYLFTAFSYGLTSDRLRLYFKDFARIKFSVPSLPEQQKIASFLSAVDEKIQQLTAKKNLLEQYKKGVMQKLFSGKIRFKDENGNDFPDWEEKVLGELVKVIDPHPSHRAPKAVENGIPFIGIGDINSSGTVDFKNVRLVSDQIYEEHRKRYIIEEGDFAYGRVASIGKVADLSDNKEKRYTYSPTLAIIKPFDVNSVFIKFYMNSEDFITIVNSKTSGSTRKSLGIQNLRIIDINFPCLKEQQKIATYLSSLDTKIETVNKRITQTQTFKKGLLQQMFV